MSWEYCHSSKTLDDRATNTSRCDQRPYMLPYIALTRQTMLFCYCRQVGFGPLMILNDVCATEAPPVVTSQQQDWAQTINEDDSRVTETVRSVVPNLGGGGDSTPRGEYGHLCRGEWALSKIIQKYLFWFTELLLQIVTYMFKLYGIFI